MLILKRINFFLLGILFVFISNQFYGITNLYSQLLDEQNPYKRFQYGLFGNGGLDYQITDFRALPGVPNCCPQFTQGKGWGINGGLFAEIPFNNTLFGKLRAGFEYNSNKLTSDETFIYNTNGEPQLGKFQHILKTRFSTATTDLLFGIRPVWTTMFYIGLRGGYHISSKFDQWEELVSPSFGTFENGRRTRNEYYNQDLPNAQILQISGVLGFGFEIPLNKNRTVRLAPEIIATAPINPEVQKYNWWNFTLNAGFTLKFSKYPVYPLSVDIHSIDTLKIENLSLCNKIINRFSPSNILFIPKIAASAGIKTWDLKLTSKNKLLLNLHGEGDSIPLLQYSTLADSVRLLQVYDKMDYELTVTDMNGSSETGQNSITVKHIKKGTLFDVMAAGLDSSGKQILNQPIKIEEQLSTVAKPLLNCIFFDENKYEIPSKYNLITAEQALNFTVEGINRRSPIVGYYDILNLIGKRLVDNPDVKILIEGCNSGKAPERNDTTLALRRAAAVRDYLMRIWAVQSNRLILSINRKAGGAPRHPSFPNEETDIEEAKAENMRAEITVLNGNDIISDPVVYSDTIIDFNPPFYNFKTNINSPSEIKNWSLSFIQGKIPLRKFSANNAPLADFKYNIDDNIRQIAKIGKSIDFLYTTNNIDDLECENDGTIPVQVSVKDSMLHISAILLFSFESYELNQSNVKILDYIRQFLRDGSKVSITGYTDKSGFPHVNQRLSKNRALTTASLLFSQELTEDTGYPISNYGTSYVIKNRTINFHTNRGEQPLAPTQTAKATLIVLGVGKQEPYLSDNSIPEGRFYSRAVTIDIRVPIAK